MSPEQFLRRIFRDSRGYLCLARISRLNGKGPFEQFFYRYPDELDQAVAWIEESNTVGMDLYFCVHLLKRQQRRKEDALPCTVLWADLDECDPKHLGKYGEPQPQLVVQSSEGHWQAYWLLKKPVAPQIAEEFSHRIALAYREFGADLSGHDLTQLLRLPTFNWKRVTNGE